MSMNAAALGFHIQDRRTRLRLDQRSLAELSEVSVHTISNLETGKGNPTLEVLTRVLDVLGLELVVRPRQLRA